MTFEESKHLKVQPTIFFAQSCFQPYYNGNKWIDSIQVARGGTYINRDKKINTRRSRTVKHACL